MGARCQMVCDEPARYTATGRHSKFACCHRHSEMLEVLGYELDEYELPPPAQIPRELRATVAPRRAS